MNEAEQIQALRQVDFTLQCERYPTGRACGLTNEQLTYLANEELVQVFFTSDDGDNLDRYCIERILPKGLAVLSRSHAAEPTPLKISVVTEPKSWAARIFEATRGGAWDLVKVAVGALVGWWLKKYFS